MRDGGSAAEMKTGENRLAERRRISAQAGNRGTGQGWFLRDGFMDAGRGVMYAKGPERSSASWENNRASRCGGEPRMDTARRSRNQRAIGSYAANDQKPNAKYQRISKSQDGKVEPSQPANNFDCCSTKEQDFFCFFRKSGVKNVKSRTCEGEATGDMAT